MKINIRFSRLFLLAIPLTIYGTELLFWFVMMKRNILENQGNYPVNICMDIWVCALFV